MDVDLEPPVSSRNLVAESAPPSQVAPDEAMRYAEVGDVEELEWEFVPHGKSQVSRIVCGQMVVGSDPHVSLALEFLLGLQDPSKPSNSVVSILGSSVLKNPKSRVATFFDDTEYITATRNDSFSCIGPVERCGWDQLKTDDKKTEGGDDESSDHIEDALVRFKSKRKEARQKVSLQWRRTGAWKEVLGLKQNTGCVYVGVGAQTSSEMPGLVMCEDVFVLTPLGALSPVLAPSLSKHIFQQVSVIDGGEGMVLGMAQSHSISSPSEFLPPHVFSVSTANWSEQTPPLDSVSCGCKANTSAKPTEGKTSGSKKRGHWKFCPLALLRSKELQEPAHIPADNYVRSLFAAILTEAQWQGVPFCGKVSVDHRQYSDVPVDALLRHIVRFALRSQGCTQLFVQSVGAVKRQARMKWWQDNRKVNNPGLYL